MLIYLAIFLVILGGALLVAEAFTPGFGVFGISGLISIVASAIITMVASPFGAYIVIGELVFLGAVMLFILDYARKKQLFGKIILNETLNNDESEIGDISFFLGKEGITKTPLKPVGTADFNGVLLEVYSQGDFIQDKKKIKVVEISNKRIIVKQIAEQ